MTSARSAAPMPPTPASRIAPNRAISASSSATAALLVQLPAFECIELVRTDGGRVRIGVWQRGGRHPARGARRRLGREQLAGTWSRSSAPSMPASRRIAESSSIRWARPGESTRSAAELGGRIATHHGATQQTLGPRPQLHRPGVELGPGRQRSRRANGVELGDRGVELALGVVAAVAPIDRSPPAIVTRNDAYESTPASASATFSSATAAS